MTKPINNKELPLYPVCGETVSFLLPLILAILGGLNSIFFAKAVLNFDFSVKGLTTYPANNIQQDLDIVSSPTYTQKTQLPMEMLGQDKVVTTNENTHSLPNEIESTLVPEKKIRPEENIDNTNESISPILLDNQNESSVIQHRNHLHVASKPESFTDQKSTIVDCPPRLLFNFSRGSEIPIAENIDSKIIQLKKWLQRKPESKILIEGHADTYGPAELNILISYRRAKAVEQILLSSGVSQDKLSIRAFGEEAQIAPDSPNSKKNRIASVKIANLPECYLSLSKGNTN